MHPSPGGRRQPVIMRRMAFSHTSPYILDRSKTVTRRTGWRFLKPGDLIQAVEKSRGLKKGEHVRPLAVLRIRDVRIEPLSRLATDARYAEDELPREGFPCWSRDEFIAKLGTVNEESDEAVYWLEFIGNVQLADEALVAPLLDEAKQLRAIFATSCETARRNRRRIRRREASDGR